MTWNRGGQWLCIIVLVLILMYQLEGCDDAIKARTERINRCSVSEYEKQAGDYTKYQSIKDYCWAKEYLGELK